MGTALHVVLTCVQHSTAQHDVIAATHCMLKFDADMNLPDVALLRHADPNCKGTRLPFWAAISEGLNAACLADTVSRPTCTVHADNYCCFVGKNSESEGAGGGGKLVMRIEQGKAGKGRARRVDQGQHGEGQLQNQ